MTFSSKLSLFVYTANTRNGKVTDAEFTLNATSFPVSGLRHLGGLKKNSVHESDDPKLILLLFVLFFARRCV